MSTIGNYSLLPWLRQGLANQIKSQDGDQSVKVRASVDVVLNLSGEKLGGGAEAATVTRPVALFGPGDIVGIEERAVVRREPRDWITNFEPNYVPHIEFYDEDFPWRYTPAAPQQHRLRPWIALVVLKGAEGDDPGEFTDGQNLAGGPLAFIDVPDLTVFPPAAQLWAWAHVHVNRSLASGSEFTSENMAAVLPKLQAELNQNADIAFSRIVSPRKLAENTPYHAFLMPVFETGRLAGLGLDPAASPHASHSAWEPYPAGTRAAAQSFPYYSRWYFRTTSAGDFESLVRLLVPKPVDPRVGRRDLDVQTPAPNLPPVLKDCGALEAGGVLRLGGALRAPRTVAEIAADPFEHWDTPNPRPFQEALARFINLADDYAKKTTDDANAAAGDVALDPEDDSEVDADPLITPPLYGTWHALTKRLLFERDGTAIASKNVWVHELNLDPRHRVAAGFGTGVVQDQQEKFMDAAWEQVGQVLEQNRLMRLAQLAKAVLTIFHERHLLPMQVAAPERVFSLTAPVHKRVMGSPFTVHHYLSESLLQPAMVSVAMRRLTRPGGRLMRALPFDSVHQPGNLLTRVAAGEVTAAPPQQPPAEVLTVDQIADTAFPQEVPPALADLLRRLPWFRFLPLLLAVLIFLLLLLLLPPVAALLVGAVVAVGLFLLFQRLSRWQEGLRAAEDLREENRRPETIDRLPSSPDFVLTEPGSGFLPTRGTTDSIEAARFKLALRDAFTLIVAANDAGRFLPKPRTDLVALTNSTLRALDPAFTVPRRFGAQFILPGRIKAELPETFVEAMAYPVIDQPMYEPLAEPKPELFLPNINLLEPNSVTLLQTNQKFIEAYMVGLNHEFSRELLWREYPTDQRGSYFRQFWDVRSCFNREKLDPEIFREKLRDIPKLHLWPKNSALGDHDQRERSGEKEEEVVLVIRGELLKRYPNTVIYAHRAAWQTKSDTDPTIDKAKERRMVTLEGAEADNPLFDKVRTPLYEAQVKPDIYFFGFDITVEEAKGETPAKPDDPGWFFVIKERPGEPRFGLDLEKQADINVWNDLSWPDVQPGAPGTFLEITAATPTITVKQPTLPAEVEKQEQHADDTQVVWSKNMSSADLAYILFQAPVLVAVHAAEMLRKD